MISSYSSIALDTGQLSRLGQFRENAFAADHRALATATRGLAATPTGPIAPFRVGVPTFGEPSLGPPRPLVGEATRADADLSPRFMGDPARTNGEPVRTAGGADDRPEMLAFRGTRLPDGVGGTAVGPAVRAQGSSSLNARATSLSAAAAAEESS